MAEPERDEYPRHERGGYDEPGRSRDERSRDEHSRDEHGGWRDDRGHSRFEESADDIVRDYALWAGGFGLVPLPFVDFAAITATQVRMVSTLVKHYRHLHEYPHRFSHERLRAIIISLVGGSLPVVAGSGVGSLLKAIPVVGQVLGTITTPVLAWASTIAVGRVFIKHFETGGTLLDFNPEKMRHYYYEQFEAAKRGRPVRDRDRDRERERPAHEHHEKAATP